MGVGYIEKRGPFISMYVENTKEIKIFFNVISRHLENQIGRNFQKI